MIRISSAPLHGLFCPQRKRVSLVETLVNCGSVFQAPVMWWPSWFLSPRVVIWFFWWRGISTFTCTSPSEHATSRNTSAAPPWSSSPSPSSSSWSSRWPGSSSTTSSASDTPTPGTATRYKPENNHLMKGFAWKVSKCLLQWRILRSSRACCVCCRAGRYEQKLISLHFLADLRYTVFILVFGLNKWSECRHILCAKKG